MPGAPRTAAAHALLLGLAATAAMSACRAALPAPPPPEVAPTHPPAPPDDDPAEALARVRRLESACRARLEADTVRASLAAVDRIRLALGAVCDVESVGDDPLHWLFRCRSDAFFDLGRYAFGSAAAGACADAPALRGAAVNRWTCAGALLQASRGVLGGVELAVVGHVDAVRIAPERSFDPCPELRAAVGYTPSPPWSALPPGASDDARRVGNDQLAWCRAANVAQHLRCGMALAAHAGPLPPGDPCAVARPAPPGAPVSVVGASTAWLEAQAPGACAPPPGAAEGFPGYCAEARRVDVFVKFVPAAASLRQACERPLDDPASALWCLQDCLERAAAPTRGARTTDVPLLVPCASPPVTPPPGWYRAPTTGPDGRCRDVNLDAVRRSLRIAR